MIPSSRSLDPLNTPLGNLFGLIGGYGVMAPREALPLMREEARKALTIDPLLPEGHAMLGIAAAWFDFDWPEAERHLFFATAQGAVTPLVRLNYAMCFPRARTRILARGDARRACCMN